VTLRPTLRMTTRLAAVSLSLLSCLELTPTQAQAPPPRAPAPAPAPAPLPAGRVVDGTGAPLPRAQGVAFAASSIDPGSSEFDADGDGRFVVKDLPKGSFHLAVFPRQLDTKAPAPRLMKDRATWESTI